MSYFRDLTSWHYANLSSSIQGANECIAGISKKVNDSLQGADHYMKETVRELSYKAHDTYYHAQKSLKEKYNGIQPNVTLVLKQNPSPLEGVYQSIEKNINSTATQLTKSSSGVFYYAKETLLGKKFSQYEQEVKDLGTNVRETRKCLEAYLKLADLIANNNNNEIVSGQEINNVEELIEEHQKKLLEFISRCKIDISRQTKAVKQAKFEETQVEMVINIMKVIFSSVLTSTKPFTPLLACLNLKLIADIAAKSINIHKAASRETERLRNNLIETLKDIGANLDDMQSRLTNRDSDPDARAD
jgi:hypothetical protein